MEIQGRVTQILPEQNGQGKNGTWRKQDFVIETPGQYPKKVCMSIWGDKIDEFQIKEADEIVADINIESREYNGRWYTDVRVWKMKKGGSSDESGMPPEENYSQVPANEGQEDETDDLPF